MMNAIARTAELTPGSAPMFGDPNTATYTAPLSFAQQRLWFLYMLEPDSPAYNLAAAVHLTGALNESTLEQSLQQIVMRHEALRTTFVEVDGRPVQVIHATGSVAHTVHDLRGLAENEKDTAVRELASTEARQPFDLTHGPLLRTRLLKRGREEHVLIVAMHHIVSDGWSVGVFIRELAQLYNSFCKGECPVLPPLTIQYSDFARWQRQQLQGEVLDRHLAYWRSQLDQAESVLELPTDRPRSAVQTFRGARKSFLLAKRLTARLNTLSRREGCTLFMTLLAAFKVLLCRYAGQEDLLVGTPIANRNRVELEELIGVFVNTLVLRSNLSGNPTFLQFLGRVREMTLDAYAHQDLPFEHLMDELQPARNLSHTPLFQVMFALQNTPSEALDLTGLQVSIQELDSGSSKFDLTLSVEDSPRGLAGTLEYNSYLFDDTTIQRMIGHFETLLEGIVGDPDQPVSTLPLLTRTEQQQMLIDFNDTRQLFVREECIPRSFEAQVERTPEAIAVRFGKEELTFAELNKRANQLAHYLRRCGVEPNVLAAICIEPSVEMLIAILAVLKAGGAYVPMDASCPSERLAFMLRDTKARVVLTQENLRSRFQTDDTAIVCLDGCFGRWLREHQMSDENPVNGATLDDLAYVIYTSGSTGRPKGILIPHRGLTNYLNWCTAAYAVDGGEGAPVHSPISFDLTITALFPPLLVGRPVELLPEGRGIESLSTALENRRDFSLIKITPLHLQLLRHEVSRTQAADLTRAFVIGGENLLAEDLAFWQQASPATVLVNEYGPTETVVGCCVYRQPLGGRTTGSVPIGRPIANTELYVLDRNLQPMPIGIPGELFIGGSGLARGYLNRPELTAEKFIPNPFATTRGARLYKTGDLVRHLPDGNLEYLGRIDHQVKIRGYRIELGEIEAVVREHPGVREAVVITRQDTPGDTRVVAYVAPQNSRELVRDELSEFLKQRLPHYMLPVLVVVDRLPFTSNGKVDHTQLPVPDVPARDDLNDSFVAPRSLQEATLAKIWAEVLHLDRVSVLDNFFELGGDSILTIQVISKANQAGLHLTPRQLFQHQTISELAKAITTVSPVEASQDPVTGWVPLTPIQHWFFLQKLPNPHHWNQSVLLEINPSVPASHVEHALGKLMLHHDALRLRFEETQSGWRQRIEEPGEAVPFVCSDVSRLSETECSATIAAATSEAQSSLNLTRGPVLRAAFFDCGPGNPARLLIVIHHLAVDGVSWQILLQDLQLLCLQLSRGEHTQLPAKTSSFKQWAERLTEHAASQSIRSQSADWLASVDSTTKSLPVDHADGANTEDSLGSVSLTLSGGETQALLHEVPRSLDVHINDVLLGALAVAFREWAGPGSVLVDIEGHGREAITEDIDLSRTIGWFTTICPVQLDLNVSGCDPLQAVDFVARQRLRIPNGGIRYGVARYLSNDPEISGSVASLPDAEVIFNYLGQVDLFLAKDSLVRPIAIENVGDRSLAGNRTHLLEVNAHVSEGQLRVEWSYSRNIHDEATIAALARVYMEALRSLVKHCQAVRVPPPRISEFPLVDLGKADLKAVIAKTGLESDHSLEAIEDIYPLSSTQQGLFFHALRSPESGAYFEQLTAIVDGEMEVSALEQAWSCLVERQPIFRTGFVWEAGLKEPVQVVGRRGSLPMERLDWRELGNDERSARLEAFIRRDRAHCFNLARAPLARFALIRLGDERHQLMFSFHHLLMDGWSVPLLFKELFGIYEALRSGTEFNQQPSRPYRDYIAWLRRQDTSKVEAFWRRTLKGIASPTRLQTQHNGASGEVAYGRQIVRLSESTTAAVQSLARQSHLTLNSLLLGAWALVLNRYSRSDDMICGVTTSGRPSALPGVETMLGLFINTLPMRITLDRNADMLTWCRQLQEQQVEWREYEYSPLVQVHGWSEVPRNQPLFESIFVFENYPVDDSFLERTGSLKFRDVQFFDQASYPLSVLVVPGTEMLLGMGYDTSRLNDTFVGQMLGTYRAVVERLIQEPQVKLAELLSDLPPVLSYASNADRHASKYSDIYERSNLTKHQVLIWLGQKLHPDVPLYNLCVPFTIRAAIDIEQFQRAFQALIDRTDTFRTVIEEIDGAPQQRVLPRFKYRMETLDFSTLEDPSRAVQAWIDDRRARPFRLDRALFDAALIRVRADEFVWYSAQHHIISDGWSIKLMFDRLALYYQLAIEDRLQDADDLPQFRKYVDHERAHSTSARWLRAGAYWKEKLAHNPGPVPFYGKSSFKTTTRMRRISCELSEEISRNLRSAAQKISSSTLDAALFNIFASILCTWIHRTTHTREFRLGIPSHNRLAPEFKETIGFFMQVFPIDIRITEGDSFTSLAGKIKSELQQCLRHSQYTVENPVHAPTFEILFNYHNKEYTFDFNGTPATHDWTHPGHGTETFAFQVRNGNHSDSFMLDCDFHCDVFSSEQQEDAVRQLLCVIDAFLMSSDQSVAAVSLLSDAEKYRVTVDFNQTETRFPEGCSVSELISLQAAKRPDQVAVVCNDQSLTYAQLNSRADQIALGLQSIGVGPETVVAIAMRRGIDLLAMILAVFKAGGAYLPIDVAWPQRRSALVTSQSRSRVVIADAEFQDALAASLEETLGAERPGVLGVEDLLRPTDSNSMSPISTADNHLAYVIYTSGSSGTPKGVMVQHGGMMNHLNAKIKDLQLTDEDIIAQTASQCFDISVWQLLAVLLVGGQVVILDDATVHDPACLLEALRRCGITVMETVPSLLGALLDNLEAHSAEFSDLPSLRWMISTGEALPPHILERWTCRFSRVPICNAYGPTECSDDVSHHFVSERIPAGAVVPIGRPIANTRLYVLDDQLQPVPIGAVGELCVAGAGVGRGYLDNPVRTADVFIPDPFAVEPGARLYKTGDLARYDATGTLEHLGRIDDQVKIRGFRIELGEIETLLTTHTTLRAAAVVAREDRAGHPYLVAYVVPSQELAPDIGQLRAFLKERLPEVMVPAVFVTLAALPLTSNGKVDRNALPVPEQNRNGSREGFVPPRDDWELRLTQVWEEILDTHAIGVRDNFFDLGGHSLLAVRLMFQLHKLSGRELPLALLFERPTIEELAQVLREQIAISVSSLVPIQPSGTARPLFFVHAHGGGAIAYYSLAQQLGRNQPFYGLEAPGLDGKREPFSEVPEMASHYIRELRRIQPQGPYQVGGHSFGGLVAFEMARQLAKDGSQVSMLAILDTAAPVPGNTPFDADDFLSDSDDATALVEMSGLIERVVRKSLDVSHGELSRLGVEERLSYFLDKLKMVDFVSPDAELSHIRGFLSVHKASSRASRRYVSQAQRYSGPMTLLLSRDVAACDFRAQNRTLRDDATLGWSELVSGTIDTHTVPGDHITMLNPPNVETLALKLGACIERANRLDTGNGVTHE